MDRGMVLFLGCMLTFTSSWLGLVFAPQLQLGTETSIQPKEEDVNATAYPRPLTSQEAAGRDIYKRGGCLYCHSQQIRSEKFGNNADIQRGWGQRRTVSRDYIYDKPTMLGTMRTGPDLSNVGYRYSADWQHKHLYSSRMFKEYSVMPSFAWLYEKRKIVGQKSADAIEIPRRWTVKEGREFVPSRSEKREIIAKSGSKAEILSPEGEAIVKQWLNEPEPGIEIVPTSDAKALVAYLLSLDKRFELPEAKED
jgi:cytochrome c oxidase cbb3-type subunit II